MTLTRDETRLILSLVSRAVEQSPNGVSPAWLAIQGKLLDMADPAGRSLAFVVPGPPVPCGRSRPFLQGQRDTPCPACKSKGGRLIFTMDPKTRGYEEKVAMVAQVAMAHQRWLRLGDGPFALTVRVYREARRGDADNYVKGCKDGMTKAGVWKDDRYVTEEHVTMFVDKASPRMEIEVRELELT